DRVLPVIARDEIAARHPQNPAVHLLHERHGIGAESPDVVSRHQRYRTDAEQAGTLADDLEPALSGIGMAGELQRYHRPIPAGGNAHGLPLLRPFTPDQSRG